MDYLNELGSLAIGSRLKRLSDLFAQEVAFIYRSNGIDFEPRWFPVFHLLGKGEALSVTDIARLVAVTHPAINQTAKEMLSNGIIVELNDKNDKRKRLLKLSNKGLKQYKELQKVWRLLKVSLEEAIDECETSLLESIEAMEKSLAIKSLPERFNKNKAAFEKMKVTVSGYAPRYKVDFKKLNESWIKKYFEIEKSDLEILSAPEQIEKDGGKVFFALLNEKAIGTCALIKQSKNSFELVKMAVNGDYQGLGVGQELMKACIKYARKEKARVLTLETNSKLESAVRLYEKFGFISVPQEKNSKYSRVDLVMKLNLTP